MREHNLQSHVVSRPKSYHHIFLPQDAKGGQRPEQAWNPITVNQRWPTTSDKQSGRWASVAKAAYTWKGQGGAGKGGVIRPQSARL